MLAGELSPAGRVWLGPVALLCFALFVADSMLVLNGVTKGFDVPLERWVQHFSWGPLTYWMTLTNVTAGVIQDAVGVMVVVALFFWERRTGWLMALGSIASLIDQFVKVSVQRHRPTADLVQILNPSGGFSYPSGHAVFFTWLYFMLAFALAPHVRPKRRYLIWIAAGVLIVLACLGRVWAGAHWPTDVFGGFMLAMTWCCFVLWLPERWLPSPSWKWVTHRGRVRKVAT